MIITRQKPFSDILKGLEGKEKIFLFGCGLCATTCKTGGEKDLAAMEKLLAREDKKVTGWIVLEPSCSLLEIKRAYRDKKAEIAFSDAILSMSCGGGTQAIAEIIEDKDILPSNNTLFQGEISKMTLREARFEQKCSLCGECALAETETICPVTQCPKSLVNGPCGGVKQGKCETDRERDCVWIRIYERLKKKGRIDNLRKRKEPPDHGANKNPRSLSI
ncbi:MAG: methylenetetrahydrofolate reductase C-terminal domain-containing protein [Candidatus Omnitrophota bacterium]|nr:methylenetetrahydrofolate reductase C-terminal domain-containing protein [Candidatus Omnitrophota bacterium]